VNIHAPEHQYIVNECPLNISKPGESQWGLQGSKNATTARGFTRGHTKLQMATHQLKERPSVVQGVYMDYTRVI
jgi:hypothetical protein